MSNKNFSFESLINDESFQTYVLFEDTESIEIWDEFIKNNPDQINDFIKAKKILKSFKIKGLKVDKEKYEADLERIKIAIAKKSHGKVIFLNNKLKSFLRYAAVILVSFSVSYSIFNYVNISTTGEMIVQEGLTPKGVKSIIMLPDGSKVHLNSSSSLKYEANSKKGYRNAYLSGEAFFEVAKDPKRPFTVFSNGIATQALGTSFNIKAYSDNNIVEVYLATGEVEVKTEKKVVNLNPNKGVRFNTIDKELVEIDLDGYKVMAWKSGIIIFDNATLEEVINKLENWYGVTIKVNGISDKKWRVNGEFKDEILENVLESISFTSSFEYEVISNEVTLIF